MSKAFLNGVSKSFGQTQVLRDIDLEVEEGEFLAILGPSGCGKTTLLRLLAGFESPSAGAIKIGDRVVADHNVMVPPEQRNLGIVFQNYALWPHMSVAENVGYALKLAKLPRAERDERIQSALKTVNLTGYADRSPADLSGGQRQRVALARCLAARSRLVLLDEPLANLDVHLRATMEEEFRRFHRESGATLIYITHDQSEAMALADRIAVLDKGQLLQCASPRQLYREPANATVAAFVGHGLLLPIEDIISSGAGKAQGRLLGQPVALRCKIGQQPARLGLASCHPENLRLSRAGEAGLEAVVTARIYRGSHWELVVTPVADGALHLTLEVPDQGNVIPNVGDRTAIAFDDLWLLPEGQVALGFGQSLSSSFSSNAKKEIQCA